MIDSRNLQANTHHAAGAARRRGIRRRAPGGGCALLAVVACVLVGGAESSVAGTYVMRSCDVPGHPPAPISPWQPTAATNVVLLDGCSSGGGYRFSLPTVRAMSNPSRATLDLAAPADGRAIAIVGARAWVTTRFAGSGIALEGSLNVVTGIGLVNTDYFSDTSSASGPVTATSLPQPVTALRLSLTCSQSDRPRSPRAGADTCNPDDETPLELRGLEVTLREDVPPAGSAVGGTLLGAETVSGVRSIDYTASDGQSGLARVEAVIGETVVAARDLSGRCTYAEFTACPSADHDSLTVDTRTVPDGRHALSLRVLDAAGNRRDVQVQDVDVQNAPVSQGPLPGIGLAQLTAAFARSSRSTVIVPYGRRVPIRGRLTAAPRSGVAKARIDVFERSSRAGAREVAVGRAQTRSDGTFSYELAARRPSRFVRLAYGSIASSRFLQVRVRAASALRATLRGTLLRFSGRVLSRPLPANGKLVRLEGVSTGFKWRRFATLRTDRSGRFSGRFRLAGRRPGARYYMRVRMPAERGYPYLAATSKPVRLRAWATVPSP